jgi:hypothetical protein
VSSYILQSYAKLKKDGRALGRAGMSERVLSAVAEFQADGGTYKGAMHLAGRLKAIAAMTAADDYWREKMEHGFHLELQTRVASPVGSQANLADATKETPL